MNYDLIIIGAGWAGFNGFLKARSLGLKAVLIEPSDLGGTCLNRGCIPTKSLIHSAKIFSQCFKAATLGVDMDSAPRVNFSAMQQRKEGLIRQLRQGMEFLLKDGAYMRSSARIVSSRSVRVGDNLIEGNALLICTGSIAAELPALPFDHVRILSSDDILMLPVLPKSLAIIGGGVIGCEFASLFTQLGTRVTLVEYTPGLLPGVDRDISAKLEAIFRKKGVDVRTATDASSVPLDGFEKILVCTGRKPFTTGLNIEAAGIVLESGAIKTDLDQRTSVASVFAAGDCTGTLMLAHAAAAQARHAVEVIAGKEPAPLVTEHIPACVFTDPQIGYVGINEVKAAADGRRVFVRKFDFLGSGMARIIDEKEGFVKLVFEEHSQRLIGASIIGPGATESIAALSLAVGQGMTFSQLRSSVMAHPSLSETISEMLQS